MNELTLFELIIGMAVGMWPVTLIVIVMTIGLAISEWRDERAEKNRREIVTRRHNVADMKIRRERSGKGIRPIQRG